MWHVKDWFKLGDDKMRSTIDRATVKPMHVLLPQQDHDYYHRLSTPPQRGYYHNYSMPASNAARGRLGIIAQPTQEEPMHQKAGREITNGDHPHPLRPMGCN